MKFYYAIVQAQGNYFKHLNQMIPNVRWLLSFYYWKEPEKYRLAYPRPIFADSGGYSARVQNVAISVQEYSDWLKDINFEVAANLDTNDFDESVRNYNYLKAQGHKILPVIHVEEYGDKSKHKWIDQMIEECDYIAIGGVAGRGVKQKAFDSFFSTIFSKTRDEVKVHGFGLTRHEYLKRFPFYSVDSNSWNSCERYGFIYVYNNAKIKLDRERLSEGGRGSKIGGKLMWGQLGANDETRIKRIAHNIKQYQLMEEDLTRLWKARGVTWR